MIMIPVLGRNNFRLIMWNVSRKMKSTVLDFVVEVLCIVISSSSEKHNKLSNLVSHLEIP